MHCPRCQCDISLPTEIDMIEQRRIAIVAQQNRLLAIQELQNRTSLSLSQAKSYVIHLAREGGVCHRCDHRFEEYGPAYCPKCKSLNLYY